MIFLLACHPEPPWTPTQVQQLWQTDDSAPIPLPESLADAPWLMDVSTWRWSGDGSEDRADSGSFGVGDGHSFALIGLDRPHATVTNLIGPQYQVHDGFFADLPLQLMQDGMALPLVEERVQRPRGTAMVRTWALHEGGATLQTLDLVASGVLLRQVTVTGGLGLGLRVGEGGVRGQTELVLLGELPEVITEDPQSFTLAYAPTGTELPAWPLALADAQAHTAQALARAAVLHSPDPAVDDLYEGMLVTLLAQTDASGLVSPMSRYTSGWLRDSEGPVRLFVAAGLFEEAELILRETWRVAAGQAAISNSFPLDAPRADTPPDWDQVPFMDGRNPVEAPSYPVLLDALYRKSTGRPAIEDEAFLRACVMRQQVVDGLLPFSGDETFRYTLAPLLGELPEDRGWSLNSAVLWIAAAEALDLDASAVRARTEEVFLIDEGWSPVADFDSLVPYPRPFEDVSLQPMRLLGDDRGLDATLELLLQEDGTLWSEGALGTTGMVPAYLLSAVADRAEGERAFNALAAMATPSGHFEEIHTADHRPLDLVHQADGLGADVTARYRPWEGGLVLAAMLDYLVGAEVDADARTLALDPHLPNGWPEMTWERLPLGLEGRYELRVEGYEEGMIVQVERQDDGPTWTLNLGGQRVELPGDGAVRLLVPRLP